MLTCWISTAWRTNILSKCWEDASRIWMECAIPFALMLRTVWKKKVSINSVQNTVQSLRVRQGLCYQLCDFYLADCVCSLSAAYCIWKEEQSHLFKQESWELIEAGRNGADQCILICLCRFRHFRFSSLSTSPLKTESFTFQEGWPHQPTTGDSFPCQYMEACTGVLWQTAPNWSTWYFASRGTII